MKTLIFLITIIAATSLVRANEIIPIWNRTIEATVQDMDFLKGQEEIIMLVGEGPNGLIQRRSSSDGELIQSISNSLSSITLLALTPDSTKFIHINGNSGRVRSIDEEFSVTSQFILPQEGDSIVLYFKEIVVDPIRPVAYVTTEGWITDSSSFAEKHKVVAYNYETGEKVKDYTEYGDEDYSVVEVSHDGKYLAAMNDGDTYLKVWDLEQDELIINESLFDPSSERRSEPEDIYFSMNDNNLIYISGLFTEKVHTNDLGTGVYKFEINTSNRSLELPEETYGGWDMVFFDNETRLLSSTSNRIGFINIRNKELELYGKPPENIYSQNIIYNNKYDFFLGVASSNNISLFRYDRETSVEQQFEEEIVISPNPTHSIVKILIECIEPNIIYDIYNTDSALINQGVVENHQNNFIIDFSSYPTGVYFLTFICNKEQLVYKIVKEG